MELFALTDPRFWFWVAASFGAVWLAWYIPGAVMLRHLRLTFFHRVPLALAVGIIFWGWQGYLLGWLGIRWATYAYVVVFFILYVRGMLRVSKAEAQNVFRKILQDKLLLLLIIAGVAIQMTTVLFVGIPIKQGVMLCCGDSNDNLWFASLTHELIARFPPTQPGLAGVVVQNYHYWSNIVIAELVRVFRLPLFIVHFPVTGFILSVLLGWLAVQFGRLLNLGKSFGRWVLLFLYFGGDAIWLLLLALGKGLTFSMSSLEDGSKFLGNLPRAFAVVLFLAGLNLFILWRKKYDVKTGAILSFLFASLTVYKIYLGIFAFAGFGLLGLRNAMQKKFRVFWMAAGAGLLALAAYLPTNSAAGGLFYTGFWRAENFIVQPALGLIRWEMARIIYFEHMNIPRIIATEAVFFFLYMSAIFGTKLLGLVQTKKSLSRIPADVHILLLTGLIVSFIAGFFFEQNVGTANTFNFLVSVFILGSLYTALAVAYWTDKLKGVLKYVCITLIILATAGRVVYEGGMNVRKIVSRDTYVFPWSHIEAMNYLRTQTPARARVAVRHRDVIYDSTAPVIALFSDRPMFYSGGGLLKHFQVPLRTQEQDEKLIFDLPDGQLAAQALARNNIDYLYYLNIRPIAATESALYLENVYVNDDVTIARVRHDVIKRDYMVRE